jgi:4-amino-4-deoxy-L-arabinose transferase-like glycosyltransferase
LFIAHWEWVALALILLVAAFLRLYRLDSIPPGLTHDEAGHGQDAIAILHGARPLYETIGYGREPLYDYATATAMSILGRADYLALRGVSATFGLLAIAIAYLWVRRAFGPWKAALACAWLAGSFWAVSASRQALRSGMLPALLAAAVYTWWRGAFDPDDRPHATWAWFTLSGLFVGATLWTYMAARVTWTLFLVFPLFLLVTDRRRFTRRWPGMLLALALAGATAAPMFIWLQQHPGAEQRFDQLGQPLRLLATGDIRQVWTNSLEALGMFALHADDLWMYNLPGRPWLGIVEGILFYAGVALAFWRWRRPQYALALMWLAVGMLPSMITGVSASATRAVAILPVLYLFPAIAVTAGLKWTRSRLIVTIMAAVLVVLAGGHTYYDYFDVWSNARDVRVAYHTTLLEIAHDLDRQTVPPGTTVVLSSIYPGRYHDPYALDLILARHDLSLRWVDGRGALVFPASPARLIVSALAPLDPALERSTVPPYARLIESRRLRPDDLNPGFDVYDWDSASALEALLPQARGPVAWSAGQTFPTGNPQSVYQALDLPVDLGHTLALEGYTLSSPTVTPGYEVTLVTYWRVLSPPDPQLDTVLFTHLLAPEAAPPVIAQQDRLDAPAWNWHPGEVFAQVHRLTVGDDVAAGLYPLEVGAYTRSTPSPVDPDPPATRLTLYVEGQPVSDRILLPPLQVKREGGP